jgi:hypothetical protein
MECRVSDAATVIEDFAQHLKAIQFGPKMVDSLTNPQVGRRRRSQILIRDVVRKFIKP